MEQRDLRQTYSPTGNHSKAERASEIDSWNIESAKQAAQQAGMELSLDHIAVLTFLRSFYVEHGWPKGTHELIRLLDEEFSNKGGKKYLHQLFPAGPVEQATRLAGLPTPSYAVDESFGSTY